ncbi:2OG-Fe dioxygenase family protein [Agrobacterium vitis]|uniref:2OG-Fe dioxygenase family protein n=1 Tax=Agrobacterium vitis TaxID=373 RepID=UPI0018D23E3C
MDHIPETGFLHISDLALRLGLDVHSASDFLDHWSDLSLDHKYKHYTQRYRRVLRYWLTSDGDLERRNDTIIVPRVKREIEGSDRLNQVETVHDSFVENAIFQAILLHDLAMVPVSQSKREVDIHLFRVQATDNKASPTTSGIHQDGAELVFMHFIGACNAQPVWSRIYPDKNANPIWEAVLGRFLETLIVDDTSVYHQADAVQTLDPGRPAYRDMLIVTVHPAL